MIICKHKNTLKESQHECNFYCNNAGEVNPDVRLVYKNKTNSEMRKDESSQPSLRPACCFAVVMFRSTRWIVKAVFWQQRN